MEKSDSPVVPDLSKVEAFITHLEENRPEALARPVAQGVERIVSTTIAFTMVDDNGDDVQNTTVTLDAGKKHSLQDFARKVGFTDLEIIQDPQTDQIYLEIRDGDRWFRVLNIPNQLTFEPKQRGMGFLVNQRLVNNFETDREFSALREWKIEGKGLRHPRERRWGAES